MSNSGDRKSFENKETQDRQKQIDELFEAIKLNNTDKINQFIETPLLFLEEKKVVLRDGSETLLSAIDYLKKIDPIGGMAMTFIIGDVLEEARALARMPSAPPAPIPSVLFDEEERTKAIKKQDEMYKRSEMVVQLLQAIDTGNTDEVKYLLNQDPTLLDEKGTITITFPRYEFHGNAEELVMASRDFDMGEILQNYRRILNKEVEPAPPPPPAPRPGFFNRTQIHDKGDDKKIDSTLEDEVGKKNKTPSPRGGVDDVD